MAVTTNEINDVIDANNAESSTIGLSAALLTDDDKTDIRHFVVLFACLKSCCCLDDGMGIYESHRNLFQVPAYYYLDQQHRSLGDLLN